MALQRITQPTAALVRAATAYDWIVQLWGLPSTPITALALDRVAHRIRPSAEPLAGSAVCARFVRGFRWAADDDGDDSWRLYGLSGSGDAVDGGVVGGRSWLVATWQHRDARRTRVSFVDVTDSTAIRYTHVLLGEPSFDERGATFRDVACEACGIAWYGDRLYLCDPVGGLRVFALDQIKAVPRGDRSMIGRQADGSYRAHGERYVAPQIATYEPLPGFRHGWSFCSIDRSVSPHALVTGEYDDGPSPLYWWALERDGMLATANGSRVAVPMLAAATRETYLGAVHASRRGAEVATAWSVSSHGTTQLAIERDDAALRTARHAWPDEIVGLTYFPHSDELWSSSGTHGARVAFSVHRSTL